MGQCIFAITEEEKANLWKMICEDSGKIYVTNSNNGGNITAPSKSKKNYKIFGWNFPADVFKSIPEAMDNYSFLCIAVEKPKKEEKKE